MEEHNDSRALFTAATTALERDGFWYERSFAPVAAGKGLMAELARGLGDLRDDVVITNPTRDAPDWAPFDQAQALGWHNDFSRDAKRPRYSLAFINNEDPRGSPFGDWRVARVSDVVDVLGRTEGGQEALRALSTEPMPFLFDGQVRWFQVFDRHEGEPVMRFYGATLRKGCTEKGQPKAVLDAITMVEDAAEQVSVELAATTGTLLVVDNWRTLHFRREQSVGLAESRQAILMFAG